MPRTEMGNHSARTMISIGVNKITACYRIETGTKYPWCKQHFKHIFVKYISSFALKYRNALSKCVIYDEDALTLILFDHFVILKVLIWFSNKWHMDIYCWYAVIISKTACIRIVEFRDQCRLYNYFAVNVYVYWKAPSYQTSISNHTSVWYHKK